MGSLANSEDLDEMPQKVAFHQGLHYLLRDRITLNDPKLTFHIKYQHYVVL